MAKRAHVPVLQEPRSLFAAVLDHDILGRPRSGIIPDLVTTMHEARPGGLRGGLHQLFFDVKTLEAGGADYVAPSDTQCRTGDQSLTCHGGLPVPVPTFTPALQCPVPASSGLQPWDPVPVRVLGQGLRSQSEPVLRRCLGNRCKNDQNSSRTVYGDDRAFLTSGNN